MMTSAFDGNRRLGLPRVFPSTPEEPGALTAFRAALDPFLPWVTRPEDREWLYRGVRKFLAHGRLPRRTGLVLGDFMGAIEVFCIALVASLPAVLPLLLIDHPWLALRISNLGVVGL